MNEKLRMVKNRLMFAKKIKYDGEFNLKYMLTIVDIRSQSIGITGWRK